MKILAAIDGSTASLHAAKLGLELARDTRGTLTLLYVTAPVVVPSDWNAAPDSVLPVMEPGDEVLQKAMAQLGAPAGTRTRNLVGSPAELIIALTAREHFELVVVGNSGRGAVARVLVGSVSDALVHECEVPVLVVR